MTASHLASSRPWQRRGFASLVLAALLPFTPGCGPSAPAAEPVARVLLVGLDGLEWNVLRPLLAEGRCPNLRALMERGSFGYLASMIPTLSPVVWTTVATGKPMEQHGILNFLDARGEVYTSGRRAVSALWNIADSYGLSTGMYGWFVTWPTEPVAGLVVSGSSASSQSDENWKPALLPGVERQVWPLELEAEILARAAAVGERGNVERLAEEKVFGKLPLARMDAAQRRTYQQTLWSILSDATYFEIAREWLAKRPTDLSLVFFGGSDVVGHRYWREYEPDAFAWAGDPELDRALSGVVPRYYEWLDEMLGELVAAAGPEVTVLVLSDHGMHAHPPATGQPDPYGVTGHHLDAPPGVLIAAGPGIVQQGGVELFLSSGALPVLGSVMDVTPTVLALLGIPVGRDMSGRAFKPMLEPGPARANAELPPVRSHDAGFRPPTRDRVPESMAQSFTEHFGGIGYLDLGDIGERSEIIMPGAPGRPDGAAQPPR